MTMLEFAIGLLTITIITTLVAYIRYKLYGNAFVSLLILAIVGIVISSILCFLIIKAVIAAFGWTVFCLLGSTLLTHSLAGWYFTFRKD